MLDNQVLAEHNHCILIAVVEDNKCVIEYVMSNQETGATHSLIGNPKDTPHERLISHWQGFAGENAVRVQVVQFGNKKQFLPYFNTLKELLYEISEQCDYESTRRNAVRHGFSKLMKRSDEIIGMCDGQRVDEYYWGGKSKHDLDYGMTMLLKDNSSIDELWISGGYDAVKDNDDFNTCSHFGEWDILLWDRETNFVPFNWILL